METVASGITLSEDESAATGINFHVVDGVEDFVEEVDELDGVGGGADAVVHHGHVCYMAVILFVEIDTIPARLKMHLCSQSIDAVRFVHAGCLGGRVSLEASKGDAVSDGANVLVGEVLCVVGAGGGVAGEHAEAFGEGLDVCGIFAATFVVDCHALVRDFFEGAVGVVVVELRGPVGGFVFLDFAGGAVGLLEGGVSGIEADI